MKKPGQKPAWVKVKAPDQEVLKNMEGLTEKWGVHTICESAVCPNVGRCFAQGTATFLILGDVCTRGCRFCAVARGGLLPPDPGEPARVAAAVQELSLDYAVITSVTRDDLDDGGAAHYGATVRAIKEVNPDTEVEVLIPDFGGSYADCAKVAAASPSVYGHNLETVPRLYPLVRRGADYKRSLSVLHYFKRQVPGAVTKTSLILGLGETEEEVIAVMEDLREVDCDILALGQYLQPSPEQYPVQRYLSPEEFDFLQKKAEKMGFAAVASGTFVRSSYEASKIFHNIQAKR